MINYIIYSLNLPCPSTFNSAEFYVSQLSIIPDKEAESYRKVFEKKKIDKIKKFTTCSNL